MDNVFQHNYDSPDVASDVLYGNLMNKNVGGMVRINPTSFLCQSTDDDSCHMIVSTANSHVFTPVPTAFYSSLTEPKEPVVSVGGDAVSEEDMLVTQSQPTSCRCKGVCESCGGQLNDDVVATPEPVEANPVINQSNDPNTPDDVEIIAVVKPEDIYSHIPDSELMEAFLSKMAKAIIPHKFATKERAIKEVGKALVKKYSGSFTQHNSSEGTHVQKDGRVNKVIAEDSQYKISSYKI